MPPQLGQPQDQLPGATPFRERRARLGTATSELPASGPESPVPGLSPQAGAGLVGLSQGARTTLPIAGAGAGGMLGGPLGAILGTAIGFAGQKAIEATTDVPTVDELPDELRPFGVAGEVFGGSAAPTGAVMAAGARGARTGRRFIDRILESAQRSPRTFATMEAGAAAGGAGGAGIASAASEGNPLAEFGGAMLGAVTNPASRMAQGGGLVADTIRRLRGTLSRGGTEDRAAVALREVLQELDPNADPKIRARQLREGEERFRNLLAGAGIDVPQPTTAQVLDNPAFRALEAEMRGRDSGLARRTAQSGADTLEASRRLIRMLSASGDPEALKAASELRQQHFESLLAGRLARAEQRAQQLASQISPDSPAARAELGRRMTTILDDALSQARRAEREAWEQVPQGQRVQPTAVIDEANRIAREELLPEETLPPLAKAFTNRVGKAGTANVREMLLFRSRMLDEARSAHSEGRLNDARILGSLAETALEDLGEVEGVQAAREFSRTLNDVFTRSFVGQAQQSAKTGARRIPPELLVQRATAGPTEALDLRMNELERAVRMGSPEAAEELTGLQERVLRLTADEIVDPNTGLASGPRLNRFIRSNEQLLEKFPEVKTLLRDVDTANAWLKEVKESGRQVQRSIQRDAAFSRVANAENPVREVGRILTGPAPQRQFTELARLAQRSGDEAVQGMRSAVLQNAFERAGGEAGEFNFTTFRNALMESPRPGQPSAMQLMRSSGVMDSDTASRLTRLLDEADRAERIMREQPQLDTLLEDENFLYDLVARLGGAKLGTAAAGATGGPVGGQSIVAAGAGSRFSRQILEKIPSRKEQELLIKAAENPGFMATLLERPTSARGKVQLARRLNAWLVGLGLAEQEEATEAAQEQGGQLLENARDPNSPLNRSFQGQP